MCLTAPSDFGASTSPAAADRPERRELASASVSSRLRPDAASAAEIDTRSSSVSSPKFSRPSTNRRNPWSVGRRPAEVWGANSSPASVRSAMTLRMVAGERLMGRRRARVRDPTGSPVATYCSTISRSTAAERASRPGGSGGGGAGNGWARPWKRGKRLDGGMGIFIACTPTQESRARGELGQSNPPRSRF